ncbi:MAG: hypothetical protein WBI82_12390 [Sphaerochaeta sp.]
MRKGRKMLMIALGIVVGIVLLVLVFFALPYSKTRKEFSKGTEVLISDAGVSDELFTLEDIASLPLAV